jgi:hypothetical protein
MDSFLAAISSFLLGTGLYLGSDYMTKENSDRLLADLTQKFSSVPCDTARDVIVSPAESAMVSVAVTDSLGDSIGVTQVMREIKPRVVAGIDCKYNPSYVTGPSDTIYKVVWVKRGDSVFALRYGRYLPVEGRLIADYVTTAER